VRFKVRTGEPREDRLTDWHLHFCLLPRKVGSERVWLETVERKGKPWASWHESGYDWEYRERLAPEVLSGWQAVLDLLWECTISLGRIIAMAAVLLFLFVVLAGCQVFETTVPVHKRPTPVVSQCATADGVQVCKRYDRDGTRRYDCERSWSNCKVN
jgi:hypothetical protein